MRGEDKGSCSRRPPNTAGPSSLSVSYIFCPIREVFTAEFHLLRNYHNDFQWWKISGLLVLKFQRKKLLLAGAVKSNWHLGPFANLVAVLFNAVLESAPEHFCCITLHVWYRFKQCHVASAREKPHQKPVLGFPHPQALEKSRIQLLETWSILHNTSHMTGSSSCRNQYYIQISSAAVKCLAVDLNKNQA